MFRVESRPKGPEGADGRGKELAIRSYRALRGMARILDFLLNLVKVTGESLADEGHALEQTTDKLKTHRSPLIPLSFHIMSLYVDCVF